MVIDKNNLLSAFNDGVSIGNDDDKIKYKIKDALFIGLDNYQLYDLELEAALLHFYSVKKSKGNMVDAYSRLAEAYFNTKRIYTAKVIAGEVLKLTVDYNENAEKSIARAYSNYVLGNVYMELDLIQNVPLVDNAVKYFTNALKIIEPYKESAKFLYSQILDALGNVYDKQYLLWEMFPYIFKRKHQKKSNSFHKKAIEYKENISLNGDITISPAINYATLSLHEYRKNNIGGAIEYIDKAIAITSKMFYSKHISLIEYYNLRSVYLRKINELEASEASLQTSMDIFVHNNNVTHNIHNLISVIKHYASVYSETEEFDKAIELYELSLSIYEQQPEKNYNAIKEDYNKLLQLHQKMNNELSIKKYKDAVDRLTDTTSAMLGNSETPDIDNWDEYFIAELSTFLHKSYYSFNDITDYIKNIFKEKITKIQELVDCTNDKVLSKTKTEQYSE